MLADGRTVWVCETATAMLGGVRCGASEGPGSWCVDLCRDGQRRRRSWRENWRAVPTNSRGRRASRAPACWPSRSGSWASRASRSATPLSRSLSGSAPAPSRRALPAMAATLVAFVTARVVVSVWVRPYLQAPHTLTTRSSVRLALVRHLDRKPGSSPPSAEPHHTPVTGRFRARPSPRPAK